MSNIDLQPVEDQMKKINSAAYQVLYNLLSKTYNIETIVRCDDCDRRH